MKFWSRSMLVVSIFLAVSGNHSLRAQDTQSEDQLMQRARQELQNGKYTDAERDFREIIRNAIHQNLYAHFFFGTEPI